MKLLIQSAIVTVVVLGLALGAFGFQRIADWGESVGSGQPAGGVLMVAAELYDRDGRRRVRRLWWPRLWLRPRRVGADVERDYPKADRQFLMALNRLTRIKGRSTRAGGQPGFGRHLQLSVCVCGDGAYLDVQR